MHEGGGSGQAHAEQGFEAVGVGAVEHGVELVSFGELAEALTQLAAADLASVPESVAHDLAAQGVEGVEALIEAGDGGAEGLEIDVDADLTRHVSQLTADDLGGEWLDAPDGAQPADIAPQLDAETAWLLEDQRQLDQLAAIVGDIPELQPDFFEALDQGAKIDELQRFEDLAAEVQGREPFKLEVVDQLGGANAECDLHMGTIRLSRAYVENNPTALKLLDTVAHEGRHAFQKEAVDNPGMVPEPLREQWQLNWLSYVDAATYGYEAYRAQPLEADAWTYAARTTDALYGPDWGALLAAQNQAAGPSEDLP